MAMIFIDGFDHYGIAGNLTEGVYAQAVSCTFNTSNPRTGSTAISVSATGVLRRVLGGPKTTVGLAGAYYYGALPGANDSHRMMRFNDAGNSEQISIVLQSTGVIAVKRGTHLGTLIGQTLSPVITAETYNHVEVMVFFSNTVGTVEIRVNGVTVLSLTGVDTVNTGNVECSQVLLGTGALSVLIDDVFCYDDTGSFNNTFIGDRRVLTLFPDADTIQADWTVVGSANGFDAINQANPDGDTSYISAGVPDSNGVVSEFGMENLPAGVSAISGVVLVNMSRKTEAGIANVQMSVISGASETAGTDQPMTEIYTYRQDVFEVDPASAAPFTPSEVDALLIKADRTA